MVHHRSGLLPVVFRQGALSSVVFRHGDLPPGIQAVSMWRTSHYSVHTIAPPLGRVGGAWGGGGETSGYNSWPAVR